MAVDPDSYSTVARVETLVGDIPINVGDPREFSLTTLPTIAQVEAFIDNVAAEINNTLAHVGYVNHILVGDDKAAFNYIRYANDCGAALQVLDMMPMEAYQGIQDSNQVTGRRGHFQNVYLAALRAIRDEKLSATRLSGASRLGDLRIGSELNSDGETKLPMFKRGGTDNPSSRSLTEA